MVLEITREYPRYRGTGTRCAPVCQSSLPYPHPHNPWRENRGFTRTRAKA